MLSSLIMLVCVLAVVGLILWALTQFPIDPTIAKVIRVVIIVVVCIWLTYFLAGLAGGIGPHTFGHPCR